MQQIVTKKHDPAMNKIAKVTQTSTTLNNQAVTQTQSQEDGELATFAAGCFWGVQLAFQVCEALLEGNLDF